MTEHALPYRLAELADYITPLTLRVICDLGVADRLRHGPRSLEELATGAGADGDALGRALRALASKGVFSEPEPGVWALTPLAELLRSDHPLGFHGMITFLPFDIAALARLDYSICAGTPAFQHVHGESYWAYFERHPEAAARFDRFMQNMSLLVLRSVANRYSWESLNSVVDVGGGNGAFLAGLLARHPSMCGTLVDLPHVVSGAQAVLEHAGVSDRCDVFAGSFFEQLPPGADGYLLKLVLHDWDDERASRILRTVREALYPNSRVLLLEAVIPPGDTFDPAKLLDVQMLALTGGRERTQREFEQLLGSADLRLVKSIPTPALSILDARAI